MCSWKEAAAGETALGVAVGAADCEHAVDGAEFESCVVSSAVVGRGAVLENDAAYEAAMLAHNWRPHWLAPPTSAVQLPVNSTGSYCQTLVAGLLQMELQMSGTYCLPTFASDEATW